MSSGVNPAPSASNLTSSESITSAFVLAGYAHSLSRQYSPYLLLPYEPVLIYFVPSGAPFSIVAATTLSPVIDVSVLDSPFIDAAKVSRF